MQDIISLEEIIEFLAHSMDDNETVLIETTELAVLSRTQIHYLDSIHHLGNPTLSELAKYLNVTKPTSTIMIEKLEEKGYVTKVPSDQDRRTTHVHLTEKGESMSALHDQAYSIYAKYFTEALTGDELEMLTVMLKKVIKRIKNI